MKRYFLPILFILVLITPFMLAPARPKRSGLRLVVITPHVEGIKREFADAFSTWHQRKFGQPVQLDYRVYGGASEIVRFFKASQPVFELNNTYGIDLIWGGGTYLFDIQLKEYLAPMRLPDELMHHAYPSPRLSGTRLYDDAETPRWFGAALSSFGILYNKDVLHHLNVPEPRQWRDLSDARLSNWIVAADPTRSASAKQALMIIVERAMIDAAKSNRSEDDGWADGLGMVRLISSNARYFTDAASAAPNVIAAGDAAAGMAIDFYGRSQVQAVGDDRMGYLEPAGETSIDADPVALVKGAEHAELARHFIEFLLSDDGQRLWITKPGAPGGPHSTALRRMPIVRGMYRDQTYFTDHIDPFGDAFAFESSKTRTQTLSILGDLIESSCMSLLDELRVTRVAIEKSPDRNALRAQLGKFPYDQKEALRRAREYEKASPLEKLAIKRRWQEEFRAEYAALRAAAERSTEVRSVAAFERNNSHR